MTELFNQRRYVYCLSINMAESAASEQQATETVLVRQDRFNVMLAEHLNPHIKNLRLTDAFLKFTGDGFLLMTDETGNVPALCCLATILVKSFNEEVSQASGIAQDRLPALRLSVFSGHDRRIEMAGGRKEWVGDSVRKASQLVQLTPASKVLLDEPVRRLIGHGFEVKSLDGMPGLSGHAVDEEASPLWVLGELDIMSVTESTAPELFVYTLNALGRAGDASEVALTLAEHLAHDEQLGELGQAFDMENAQGWGRLLSNLLDYTSAHALFLKAKTSGLRPDTVIYNALLTLAPDFNTAVSLYKTMGNEGVRPDIATYSTLISKSPDYDAGAELFASMRAAGIAPGSDAYNALIMKCDYAKAVSLYKTMGNEGVRPDIATYSTLISKSPDYETAIGWFCMLSKEGLQPGAGIFGALITKAPDFETAKHWLRAMERDGIQPSLNVFNRLIPKAPDYDHVQPLLESIRAEGIKLNVITYNTLISKATDFDTAAAWLEILKRDDIEPNLDTYNRLFGKNISAKPADELLAWYLSQEQHPEEPLQTAMATYRKYGRIDQALLVAAGYPHLPGAKKLIREIMDEVFAYLNTIREEAVQPSIASYNAIIAKAPYYDTAKSWLDTMRKKGTQPDIVTYNTLISKAAGFERAKSLVEMMQKDSIKPSADTFNRLFSKDLSTVAADELIAWYRAQGNDSDDPVETAISSFKRSGRVDQALRLSLEYPRLEGAKKLIRQHMAEVLSYLETIREEGVKPNVVTYSTLISKAPYYDIALAWLETMRSKGVKPNVVTYNTLIFKAPDYQTAESLLREMRAESIEANVITYSTLISKAEDYQTTATLFETMEREAIQPNIITYNALILKSPDYEAASSWLALMRRDGVAPDMMTYNTLIFKAPDFAVAEELFEAMKKEGIQPNIVTYNRLFSRDLSAKNADEIITWYAQQSYRPDEPVQAAISAFRKIGRIKDALRIALEYPHLQVARKLMREHADEAVEYFEGILAREPGHPNAEYALGLGLLEGGREQEAEPYLRMAIKHTEPGPRRKMIEALVGTLVSV